MKLIHTSTRLGLIASRYLAKAYYENRRVSAPEIANYYKMNVRTLMTALRGMSKAGLLQSQTGGLTPGFIFSKSPQNITVLDIISALETKFSAPCCKAVIPGLECDCQSSFNCQLRSLFDRIIHETYSQINNVTVAEYSNIEIQETI